MWNIKQIKVQIRQILDNPLIIRDAKNGLHCQILESPPKYFEKFRKLITCAKGHLSVVTKVISVRELRYERGTTWIEHPPHPIKDRPLLIMMWFVLTLYALVLIINMLTYYVRHTSILFRLLWKWLDFIQFVFKRVLSAHNSKGKKWARTYIWSKSSPMQVK